MACLNESSNQYWGYVAGAFLFIACRPMDVSVPSQSGQRRLDSRETPRSVLGRGLLERARSTSLALLGVTTAVGLAIVALALNQGWPVVPGSSIPLIPPRHQAVGEATVAAGLARGHSALVDAAGGSGSKSALAGHGLGRPGAASNPTGGSAPGGSADLVVLPSAPAKPRTGEPAGPPKQQSPSPAVQSPQPAAVSPNPAQAATPAAESPPPATTAEAPPPAAAPEAPVASGVPTRSHGHGHAYGRSEEAEEAGVSEGDDSASDVGEDGSDDHSWDHGHGSHGHHWDD